ncbi:MAG TPA: L,D-transpeptidase [Ktedonobacteraceae bacterium]|nr:L,D-transpeptidase [Ktedonobacteraceae bacterium]
MIGQQTQNKHFRQRKALPWLVCLALGALLLSSCSGLGSSSNNNSSSTNSTNITPAPGISLALQNQGRAQLDTFQQWITLMQQNGGDVTTYQQQYTTDQKALSQAGNDSAYSTALKALTEHISAIKIPALRQEIQFLQPKLEKDVNDWGNAHKYQDSYDGKTYTQNYEYDDKTGVGGPLWLGEALQTNKTLADYQQTIEDLQMWITSFQGFKENFNDKTAWNKVHKTDLDLLQNYGFMDERVVVVSLSEQAMRVYDHGKLVKAFQVVTGQPDLATPPGNWWVEGKKHPTVFKSSAPKNSADWYPDTKINYAMQYHSNGYFIHDAWWRTQFGKGANFPHLDEGGSAFSRGGSHGCVNMSTEDSAWLYDFVSVFTQLMIY